MKHLGVEESKLIKYPLYFEVFQIIIVVDNQRLAYFTHCLPKTGSIFFTELVFGS